MITHYRVDQRVIHGQTVTCLMVRHPCDGILIIDDEIAGDQFLASVFKGVVPSNIRVLPMTVEKALVKLPEAEASSKNYFIVFKHLDAVGRLIDKGYTFKSQLTIGIQHARPGTKLVDSGLCLTDDEIALVDRLISSGVKIIVHPRVMQKEKSWNDVKPK